MLAALTQPSLASSLLRPPLRCDTARGLWNLKWKEHFSAVNVTVQFVLPFCQDLSTALGEDEKAEAPEPEVLEETRKAFFKSARCYARTTAKQGLCIAVGCMLMLRDSGVTAYHVSVPRNLVYYWDNVGCQMPIYFNAELIRALGLPESVARLMGKCPGAEHIEYFTLMTSTMRGAAVLSFKQSWIPALAETSVEVCSITNRHRRHPRKLWIEMLRLVVDKGVLLILQCVLAALGSHVRPPFGCYWIEVLGALLLRGVVSGVAQKALRLPPPPTKANHRGSPKLP